MFLMSNLSHRDVLLLVQVCPTHQHHLPDTSILRNKIIKKISLIIIIIITLSNVSICMQQKFNPHSTKLSGIYFKGIKASEQTDPRNLIIRVLCNLIAVLLWTAPSFFPSFADILIFFSGLFGKHGCQQFLDLQVIFQQLRGTFSLSVPKFPGRHSLEKRESGYLPESIHYSYSGKMS